MTEQYFYDGPVDPPKDAASAASKTQKPTEEKKSEVQPIDVGSLVNTIAGV